MNTYRSALHHNSSSSTALFRGFGKTLRNNRQGKIFSSEPRCFHTLTSICSFIDYPYRAEHRRYNALEFQYRGLSAAPANDNNIDDDVDETKLSYSQRGKVLWKQYGYVFIGTYLSIYVATLTSLYFGIDSGWIDPSNFILDEGETAIEAVQKDEDESMGPTPTGLAKLAIEKLEKLKFMKPYIPKIENNPQLLNLGVAWISTKFLEPIRLAVTVTIVPTVARGLGYAPPKKYKK